jgi:hypothetical protein
VSDRTSTRAYPAPGAREVFDAKTYKSCPGVPDAATKAKFQTHGLTLREGRNGVHTLMTVTHGAREAIDVFTVDTKTPDTDADMDWLRSGSGSDRPELRPMAGRWRVYRDEFPAARATRRA